MYYVVWRRKKGRNKHQNSEQFLLNSSDIDIKKCYLELHDEEEEVWKLYFRFNASCNEHMELREFPFDAQFLNLQIMYRIDDYYFLSECPSWITKNDRHLQFKLHKPIKLTVKDSIKVQPQKMDNFYFLFFIFFRLNGGLRNHGSI